MTYPNSQERNPEDPCEFCHAIGCTPCDKCDYAKKHLEELNAMTDEDWRKLNEPIDMERESKILDFIKEHGCDDGNCSRCSYSGLHGECTAEILKDVQDSEEQDQRCKNDPDAYCHGCGVCEK